METVRPQAQLSSFLSATTETSTNQRQGCAVHYQCCYMRGCSRMYSTTMDLMISSQYLCTFNIPSRKYICVQPYKGDVLHHMRQMVFTLDTDRFSESPDPQIKPNGHFREAFCCGQSEAHL